VAKSKNIKEYVCSTCGYRTSKWMGKCPECEEWNSFEEEIQSLSEKAIKVDIDSIKVYNYKEVEVSKNYRLKCNLHEFDRVLGGGIVEGEVVLITGNPGVGKSTLLLQAAYEYSKKNQVYYIAGEESPSQIKFRGQRIGLKPEKMYIMPETNINNIEAQLIKEKPRIVIVDSIQTLYSPDYASIPGTTTQIRECTLKIVEIAKTYNICFFIVGHITKDGKIAGPKLLEHIVDAVLNFEGEENFFYRILRSIKNRFGSTNELGIFNMTEKGMTEVENPSEFFLSDRDEKNIGSVIIPALEGSKVFLLEIQALTTSPCIGIPKRVVQGLDYNRVQIITAIVEKKLALEMSGTDLYVNIPGGIVVKETAADLAIALSILSSIKNINISKKIAAIGELGLRGEVRKVAFLEKRLNELEKLGFKGVYLPESNKKELEGKEYNMKIIYLKNLNELLERMNKNG